MSDELTKQYAIRLPNGDLYSQCQTTVFGHHETTVVVFDTEDQARRVLDNLKLAATQLGIPGWVGQIEWRACSPFSNTDLGKSFADEVTKWAAQQGDES